MGLVRLAQKDFMTGHFDHTLKEKGNMTLRRRVLFQVEKRLCRWTIKINVRDNDVSMQCQNIWSIPLF